MNPRSNRRPRRPPTLLALLLFWIAFDPALAADPRVTFVRPRNLSTVLGPTEIQVVVSGVDDELVEALLLETDGRTLATLEAPPWALVWDAGDGSKGHTLVARVRLRDGRSALASIRTSALAVNQIEHVDLVNLYIVVRDRTERYITDLTQDDFRILEDGAVQSIERFAATQKPLRVGIVLDTSNTMTSGEKLVKAKKAALKFLDVLRVGDEGLVVTFSDDVRVAQDLTADKRLLAQAIEAAEAQGGTALYDAIYSTSRKLRDFAGRRVIVLLSDGQDEAANGLEPGSLHTLDEALEQALRNDVMVFSVGLGRDLDRTYVRRWGRLYGQSNVDVEISIQDVLQRLSDSTGGRLILATRASRLDAAFDLIAADLHHQYSLAYVSSNPRQDGKWREIRVDVPRAELSVVTRRGYYAPRHDSGE